MGPDGVDPAAIDESGGSYGKKHHAANSTNGVVGSKGKTAPAIASATQIHPANNRA